MPTTTQLTVTRLNASDARCLALFASGLQPSDALSAQGWNISLIRGQLVAASAT